MEILKEPWIVTIFFYVNLRWISWAVEKEATRKTIMEKEFAN